MNEQKKYEVIKKLIEQNGNKDRAAMTLQVSRRQIDRMIKGYKEQGKAFFIHGNRGRKPYTTIDDTLKEHIVYLYQTKYHDSNFTHFTKLLKEREGISVSVTSVRTILEQNYILSPLVTKTKQKRLKKELLKLQKTASPKDALKLQRNLISVEDAHSRRPRRSFFGEQIQLDASPHLWFGDKKTYLHIAVDDCTGRLLAAFFDTQETLIAYYDIFHQIICSYGIPYSLLTDRRTVFEYKKKNTSDLAKDTYTQFAYACKQLGVELKSSSVPQAKSRVERMFKTLQSRLPVELRLAGITQIDAANEFLRSYIDRYNTEFALPLDGIKSVFEKQPDDETINLTLAVLSERIVDSGHSIQTGKKHYRMLDKDGHQVHYKKGTKVIVIKAFDGQMFCSVNDDTVLSLEEIPLFEEYSKAFSFEPPKKLHAQKRYIPPMNHPWRRDDLLGFAKKQSHRLDAELEALCSY